MKKKHIFILIFIIILIAILAFAGHKIYKTYFCSTEISSRDNSFKLTIPNRIKYKVKDSNDENYTLDLYSVKDEMFLYSTVINKKSEINLEETVKNEKESVSKTLSNFNNILDVQKTSIQNYNSYKYAYTYSDADYGKDLYAEIVWVETDSKIYVLDLEVITKNINKYKPLFEKIESSFIENK